MNIVFIIPTGIGCRIGGHAGDATPAAKLLASVCDNLILHPNVVNASDINEMPANSWYVEGSILDRFLQGKINLAPPRRNRILLAVNKPVRAESINAVNAARHTIGAEIQIVELYTPLIMKSFFDDSGKATGEVTGWKELIGQIGEYDFDALAIHSGIEVSKEVALKYLREGGVNPWGGVEALASKVIADGLDVPVAHAPLEREETIADKEIMGTYRSEVPPQIAAEVLSTAYVHCIFKGLHRAPRIADADRYLFGKGLSVKDIDVLISPYGCIGRPHLLCFDRNITIVSVRENTTIFDLEDERISYVDNYLEAAGLVCCEKAEVDWKTVKLKPMYNGQ